MLRSTKLRPKSKPANLRGEVWKPRGLDLNKNQTPRDPPVEKPQHDQKNCSPRHEAALVLHLELKNATKNLESAAKLLRTPP